MVTHTVGEILLHTKLLTKIDTAPLNQPFCQCCKGATRLVLHHQYISIALGNKAGQLCIGVEFQHLNVNMVIDTLQEVEGTLNLLKEGGIDLCKTPRKVGTKGSD